MSVWCRRYADGTKTVCTRAWCSTIHCERYQIRLKTYTCISLFLAVWYNFILMQIEQVPRSSMVYFWCKSLLSMPGLGVLERLATLWSAFWWYGQRSRLVRAGENLGGERENGYSWRVMTFFFFGKNVKVGCQFCLCPPNEDLHPMLEAGHELLLPRWRRRGFLAPKGALHLLQLEEKPTMLTAELRSVDSTKQHIKRYACRAKCCKWEACYIFVCTRLSQIKVKRNFTQKWVVPWWFWWKNAR